jgi:hypothetical protein
MRFIATLLLTALAAGPAAAQAPATTPQLQAIIAQVQEAELKSTITTLVSFGTRHTKSDTRSETRGIGAARRWAEGRFAAISKNCGGCLVIVKPSDTFTAPRLPSPTLSRTSWPSSVGPPIPTESSSSPATSTPSIP